jgi:hypothetical protein
VTDIADALANIMHYARRSDADFERALEAGRVHFAVETGGAEPAEPDGRSSEHLPLTLAVEITRALEADSGDAMRHALLVLADHFLPI